MQYLLLIHDDEAHWGDMPEDERNAIYGEYTKFTEDVQNAGILVGANQLQLSNAIGGLSTNLHLDTGAPTVFVYDGHAGGVGIAARGFDQFEGWVADTRELLHGCPCERGCPSCVQSPKCGNLNEYLDKAGALTLLTRMSKSG